MGIVQQIADRCRVEQPVHDTLVVVVALLNIVLECRRVTLDVYLKKLLYCIAIGVECAPWKRLAVGVRRLHPQPIDFITSQRPISAYGVDKPYIPAK